MFNVRSEPLLLSEAGLYGLCVSLNTPVLNIKELAVGPARAAVVLFDGGYGSMGLAVGVRSIETRQVVVFSYKGSLDIDTTPARAMEDATSFSERMGFLFDDDIISSDPNGRSRAMKLWADLTDTGDLSGVDPAEEFEQLASPPPPPATPPPPLSPAVRLEPEPEELVLSDEAVLEVEAPGDAASDELWLDELTEAPPLPAMSSPMAEPAAELLAQAAAELDIDDLSADGAIEPSAPAAVSLSKFRTSRPGPAETGTCDPAASAATTAVSTLGRIPLVRRPSGSSRNESAKPGLLLRLLASF